MPTTNPEKEILQRGGGVRFIYRNPPSLPATPVNFVIGTAQVSLFNLSV